MAKRNRQEWCPEVFSRFITDRQQKLSVATGRKITRQEVMAIIATNQPVIQIKPNGKRKTSNLFDF